MSVPLLLAGVAGAAVFIVAASLLSGELALFRWLPPWAMRAGHFVSYAAFGCVLAFAVAPLIAPAWLQFLVAFLTATAFGALLEVLQSFRPRRTPDWTDALINAVGAAAGALAALLGGLPPTPS